MTASEVPDEAQRLREEIERTREHLGATIEELAAKADVKGRAQAKVTEVVGQVTGQARNAVGEARGTLAARKHKVPLSAVAAGVLLAAAAFIIWQRSKR